MSHISSTPLDAQDQPALEEAIRSLNERVEKETSLATNRAFNLGCVTGLLPAGLVVALTYVLTGESWVGASVMLVLMLLGLVLFANLVASISRRNTLRRVFRDEISAEIEQTLARCQVDRPSFEQSIRETLPPGAVLRELLALDDEGLA